MYAEIKSATFEDISTKTKLIITDFSDVGMSTPFKKVYINLNELNKYRWPEDVVRGAIAHELAHQVSYQRRSFLGRFWFLRNYLFSPSGRRRVEREADEIAIRRGYGREIVQVRIYQFHYGDKKRAEVEKKIYLPVEALEELIEEESN
ncbi:MAG: hypothetical protein ACE5MG_10100 [Candidatus Methylomirabilales bacterium]